MKHFRALPRLVAGAAALAALVVTGAVTEVATSGPAMAAGAASTTPAATYECTFVVSLLGVPVSATLPVPVTVSLPEVPLWDGTTVPAGSVPVSASLDLGALTDLGGMAVANAIVQLIGFDGLLGGTIGLDPSHPLTVGSVPVTSALSATPVLLADLLSSGILTGTGSLGSFVPRGTGTQSVSLPAAFDLVPHGTSGPSLGALLPVGFAPVHCTSASGAPQVVGHVSVAAAGTPWAPLSSRLTVAGPKHARRGQAVSFRVSLPGGAGRVVARVGRRMVDQAFLLDGRARLTVRGLRPGTDRIRFTAGSASATATVRVR